MSNSACPHCGAAHELAATRGGSRCPSTGLPIDAGAVASGMVVGRYALVSLLGDGGMGSVYKAADQLLHRFVAIKLLHPQIAESDALVQRFVREARAAAAVHHPNIVDVLDFGQVERTPYLVMEYLRGRSLAHAIEHDGPLPVARACAIASHALAGLHAAHERGILHRDLKPANLMLVAHLGDRDFVKICDFGFAALLVPEGRADRTLTPERTLVGTPAYAAPERFRGQDRRDPRTDLYAIGVVLYEMLAGRRPFDAPSFAELARKIKADAPAALADVRGDVPPALEAAVLRALAKEPEQRWANAAEFAAALVPFGGHTFPKASDDAPSESFTMDLIKIRARDTVQRRSIPPAPPATVEAPPDGVRALEGTVVHALLQFVATRFGDRALVGLLASLPEPSRSLFARGVPAGGWMPYVAVRHLVEKIDATLGGDDLHVVVECGHAVADATLALFAELRAQHPPPELALAELPSIAPRVIRGTSYHVRRVGRGYGLIELIEEGSESPSLTGCVTTLGFIERTLTHFGAHEVEVNLAGCRALGDAQCLFGVTWLGEPRRFGNPAED